VGNVCPSKVISIDICRFAAARPAKRMVESCLKTEVFLD
jgi:hypothetical protein